jgi:predicted nicotinamide N-methyase
MPKLERVPEPDIDYVYGIFLLNRKHKLIRALRKRYQPMVHGHKTWGSSFLVMDYLTHTGVTKGTKTMELGCGWGSLSVFCADRFKGKVTAVDLDPAVFPYVEVFAEINDVKVKTMQADITKLKTEELGSFGLIVGSDICFWDSMVSPLYRMVNRALKGGAKRIVIADPGRPTFYEFCDKVAQRHRVQLQEWYAIEPERFEGEIVEITNK